MVPTGGVSMYTYGMAFPHTSRVNHEMDGLSNTENWHRVVQSSSSAYGRLLHFRFCRLLNARLS